MIPKSQRPKKCKYSEHFVHSKEKSERKWNQGYLQVVSVDPALKNFAIRIERWNYNRTITPVGFCKYNLINDGTSEEDDDYHEGINNLTKIFKSLEDCLKKTHIFIVEKQLPQNYKVVRISQHVITYFIQLGYDSELLPSIYEIDPKLKGEILGAGKLAEKDLKKWAVVKAKEILENRGDQVSLDILTANKKKDDDLSDTVIQILALFLYIYNSENTDRYLKNELGKFFSDKVVVNDPLLIEEKKEEKKDENKIKLKLPEK
jgi:hypothetical protein